MGQQLAEQIWLRAYVSEPCEEIVLSVDAQEDMRTQGISLCELMEVLRHGSVTFSEKLEVGANITVEGRNCDHERLQVDCWIECGMIIVEILRVLKEPRR